MMSDKPFRPGHITYLRNGHCPLVQYYEFLVAVSQVLHEAIEPLHVQEPDMSPEECQRLGIEPLACSEGWEEWREQAPQELYRLNQEARELFVNEFPKVLYAPTPIHCQDEISQLIQESRELFNRFLDSARYFPNSPEEKRRFFTAMTQLQAIATKILSFGKPAESVAESGGKVGAKPKGKPGPKPGQHDARNKRIVQKVKQGCLPVDVAREFGLSKSTVSGILEKANENGD